MAYDEELADRIRDLIESGPTIAERKMFGGLSFMVSGNLALAASGDGVCLCASDPNCATGSSTISRSCRRRWASVK
ncbi:hypothetical protein [Rhodococcus sp. NPDC003348]